MTPDEVVTTIMGTISSSWATATPICYPNRQFTIPKGYWVRPTIKMGESIVGELGDDGIGMRIGLLMVSLFALENTGTITLMQYAERMEAIFRKKEISGIVFNEPSTDIIGADGEGYYHVLVSVDFFTFIGES
jgi:hypothetical protein